MALFNRLTFTFVHLNQTEIVSMTGNGLSPFPFNLDYSWRLAIVVIMTFILVYGIRLRLLILGYLVQPDTKTGAINLLIWIDQLNGIFLALNIVERIIAVGLPFPMSVITGDWICKWSALPGQLYLAGATCWSCIIAVYRVLHIRAQQWVKDYFGDRHLLKVLLLSGTLLTFTFAFLLAFNDNDSVNRKLCTHFTTSDREILQKFEELSEANNYIICWKKVVIVGVSVVAIVFNFVEMSSYVFFFFYIYNHDNTIGSAVLEANVIKQRNRVNAISMVGQVSTWILKVWYIILVGIFSTTLDMDFLREVSAFFKTLDFLFIPLIQIATSPPIKKYWINLKIHS